MSTTTEIQSGVKSINADNQEISKAKTLCHGHALNSSSWWNGAAGKILRSEYSEINTDLEKLVTKISSLENRTKSLSSNVLRADNERIEKQRKAALAANKKAANIRTYFR